MQRFALPPEAGCLKDGGAAEPFVGEQERVAEVRPPTDTAAGRLTPARPCRGQDSGSSRGASTGRTGTTLWPHWRAKRIPHPLPRKRAMRGSLLR